MQLTIDSEEPLDRVLEAVGALFGVRLTVDEEDALGQQTAALPGGDGDRVTKTRH